MPRNEIPDCKDLQRTLEELIAPGVVEVHEDGEWLAELADFHWELSRSGTTPVLHLWSSERNLVRRVLGVVQNTPGHLILDVQRFGRPQPVHLEFLRADAPRPAGRTRRAKFRARFTRLLAEKFPDARADALTTAPDLQRSFSGLYTRGMMHQAPHVWAILACPPGESSATIDDALSFGLLWLDHTRRGWQTKSAHGLRLFLPAGSSQVTLQRARALHSSAHLEIYELDDFTGRVQRRESADTGNLESWLTARREMEAVVSVAAAAELRARIASILPPAQSDGALDCVALPQALGFALRFWGVEFLRTSNVPGAPPRILFGVRDDRHELTETSWPQLAKLLRQLDVERSSRASDVNRPLYRAVPERWLETLVLRRPECLDAQLDARFLYSQVPAFSAGDRGVMDLLGVTRQGRLVVIELKASEDIHLPIQALDYWLRVREHQQAGEFPRHGYFTTVELDPRPPLLWLVAPALRFHPAAEVLLQYLSPEIQVTRIGLNEAWRQGLQVTFRM
jgi:hypothetical protein